MLNDKPFTKVLGTGAAVVDAFTGGWTTWDTPVGKVAWGTYSEAFTGVFTYSSGNDSQYDNAKNKEKNEEETAVREIGWDTEINNSTVAVRDSLYDPSNMVADISWRHVAEFQERYIKPSILNNTTALDWHYFRNTNNDPSKATVPMSAGESVYHRMGPGGQNNRKYISPDGHHEAVRNNGTLVGGVNRGTYNYVSPRKNWFGHIKYDLAPYWFLGN